MPEQIRYTPASYDARVQEWMSADEVSISTFPMRTPDEIRDRRIGDGERAAIALLHNAQVWNPLLAIWIQRLTTDPAYDGRVSGWDAITPQEWEALVRQSPDGNYADDDYIREYPAQQRAYGFGLDGRKLIYPPVDPATDGEEVSWREWKQGLDEAAEFLTSAVVTHRRKGEDGLDRTSHLGFGLSVTTSLAAAIAEYHHAVRTEDARYQAAKRGKA